jgi:dimethylhistidine N-methyltransferase
MAPHVRPRQSQFAEDVLEGLSLPGQKRLSPRYFYDDLGSALFEAITLLPEYGLTRADERVIQVHASELASIASSVRVVAELGSGSGRKTAHILNAFSRPTEITYRPIDVSSAALSACANALADKANVAPVCSDWLDGVAEVTRYRRHDEALLLVFLGSSIGNLERDAIPDFLRSLRSYLRAGDFFLLGADLVKEIPRMLAAYDDATGVTAAFNLNLLGRMNRELGADFDLRSFLHEVRWNAAARRIEMHLISCRDQRVRIRELDLSVDFRAGETIWTESSHKFEGSELDSFALEGGFTPVVNWLDRDWPFAEALWRVSA